MRPLSSALLPLLFLAGCTNAVAQAPPALAVAEPAPPPVAAASLRAGFPPGGLADVIQIDSAYRLPLRSAELIGPDGEVTPASSVEATDSPRFATGQSVAIDPWKTGIAGAGMPGIPTLGAGLTGASLRSQVQILTMASTASIPLPDPNAYRGDWQHYRIRLGFGIPPGEIETREIEAPEPPPGPPAP